MKRIIALTTALIMIIAVFAGCGGSDNGNNSAAEEKSVNLGDVLTAVNEAFPESTKDAETLASVDDLKNYYNVSTDDVKQFAAEVDKKNSSLEIVLVEAVDADAAGRVESALKVMYNQLRSNGASYDAEQLDMVNNCDVTTNGNFVIYIISKDYKGMLDTVNSKL